MSRLARSLRPLVYLACASGLSVCALALIAEHSGWVHGKVQAALVKRLGEPVTIERVGVGWLERSLHIEGLALGPDGPRLESLRTRVEFEAGKPRLARVEVHGGRVVIEDGLLARLRAHRPQPSGTPVRLPEIVVEQVDLALAHPRWGAVPIGRVDAVCVMRADGLPAIQGRVLPPWAKAGAGGELYLEGSLEDAATLVLRASCAELPLAPEALPDGELARLRALEPRGQLALSGSARISLDGSTVSSGNLRGRLSRGSFLPPDCTDKVEGLELDFECERIAVAGAALADPGAWSGTAHFLGDWNGAHVEGWGLVGRAARAGASASCWMRATDVPLQPELMRILGHGQLLREVWAALEPRGACDALAALHWSREAGVEAALECDLAGKAGGAYVGFRRVGDGARIGFPMPVEGARGKVLVLLSQQSEVRTRAALVGLEAAHASGGAARVQALIQSPPRSVRGGHAILDLWIEGEDIAIDANIERALASLPGTGWIWPTFAPAGGTCSGAGRIVRSSPTGGIASAFTVQAEELGVLWRELPAPVEGLAGTLELRFDPAGGWGVAYDFRGRSLGSERARARGRVQTERGAPHGARATIEDHQVEVENLGLKGADRDAIVARFPGIGVGLQPVDPTGKVDGQLRLTRAPDRGLDYCVEVVPRQVRFSPQAFTVETRNVRGRVIVSGHSSPGLQRTTTRIAPLLGEWAGEMQVAGTAVFDTHADARLQLFGAGLVPGNPNLAGALRAALSDGAGGGGVDLSALRVDGRVDLAGQVTLTRQPGDAPEVLYRVYLRGNDLEARRSDDARLGLQQLEGVLVQQGGELRGERLSARLGGTEVVLRQPGFRREEGAWTFESLIEAHKLPLDREHLRFFLDPATVQALIEDLALSGEIDIDGARLALRGATDGSQRMEFSGDLRPHGMRIELGLPLEIDRARVRVESLVLEGRHVRAWARAEGLDGRIAGRGLQKASLQMTYVEPHLSLLALDGELEGGRLHQLRGSPAFSIDLAPPYLFDLAMRMEDVQVGGLLRGLFESEFASRGSLQGELRLSGSLEHLSGIRGDGALDLSDTTLWSIPVMRDLFSQLGLDETAVFERMRTNLAVQSGVIHMNGIHVYSPLLQLVGAGTLDLDGRLHHDLEVRYSLVDKLGPLRRVLYWVQHNLVSVAVRGDMQRPRVELKGMLSFLQRSRPAGRDLPLPGLAPLPPRF